MPDLGCVSSVHEVELGDVLPGPEVHAQAQWELAVAHQAALWVTIELALRDEWISVNLVSLTSVFSNDVESEVLGLALNLVLGQEHLEHLGGRQEAEGEQLIELLIPV